MARRKDLPEATATAIVTRCARRCALCFGLGRNFRVKRGQIAHLDHNRGNHKPDNLVFLCLRHHDSYDSRTSQAKGFTLREVKAYRDRLYYEIENWDPKRPRQPKEQHPALPPLYGSVAERRIDELHGAMRNAGIWLQRLTTPAGPTDVPRDLMNSFTAAYARFQGARIAAVLYVPTETDAILEDMAHALTRAHLHRTRGDVDGWMTADDEFERYRELLKASEAQLREALRAVTGPRHGAP